MFPRKDWNFSVYKRSGIFLSKDDIAIFPLEEKD